MAKLSKKKAHKTPKTKITVLINKKIFDSFCATVKECGLRRDAYVNQVLPDEISSLTKAPAGSKRGELVLRTLRSGDKDIVRVGITLDSEVAKAMTEACADKHVLRDHFMEACLAHLDNVLGKVIVIMTNPGTHGDRNKYNNLGMSDEAVASLIDELSR
jgi:hypothetical protein